MIASQAIPDKIIIVNLIINIKTRYDAQFRNFLDITRDIDKAPFYWISLLSDIWIKRRIGDLQICFV